MPHAFELLQVLNDSAIRNLSIFVSNKDFVEIRLRFENHLNEVKISYKDKEDDTLVELTEYNKRLVEDENYIDVMCEDLSHILTDARFGQIIEISIRYDDDEEVVEAVNRVYGQFKIHSQKKKNPIYARSLHLQIDDDSQLRSALSDFNPSNLIRLIISTWKKKPVNLINIVEMDHWKNAKIIIIQGYLAKIPFENFSHCEHVSVKVSRISEDYIRTLVNIVSNSSCLKFFCVEYDCLNENITEQFLDNLFGKIQTGKQVRFIGNEIEFVHDSDENTIYIYKLSDKKKDKRMKTPKPPTSPSKSATLCLSNRLIMEKIVQHFDFAELAVLRRISRGSRHCVDFLKPDPKLVAIIIFLEPEFILVEVFGRNNNRKILYRLPGTEICFTSFIDYNHQADINNLSDDLVQLLKDQKTALEELCVILEPKVKEDIDESIKEEDESIEENGESIEEDDESIEEYDKFIEENDIFTKEDYESIIEEDWELSRDQFTAMFQATFSSRDTLLAVEKLNLTTRCSTRATQLLENLDPLVIKTIELRTVSSVDDVQFINDLASLEQWTNASDLKIQNFVVECDLEKLVHFAKVEIFLYSISFGDVLYLQEKFLLSSNFGQFKTKFAETEIDDSIYEDNFLGAPFRRVEDISSDQPDIWFFPYTDVLEDLQIRYYRKAKEFMFKRVSRR